MEDFVLGVALDELAVVLPVPANPVHDERAELRVNLFLGEECPQVGDVAALVVAGREVEDVGDGKACQRDAAYRLRTSRSAGEMPCKVFNLDGGEAGLGFLAVGFRHFLLLRFLRGHAPGFWKKVLIYTRKKCLSNAITKKSDYS